MHVPSPHPSPAEGKKLKENRVSLGAFGGYVDFPGFRWFIYSLFISFVYSKTPLLIYSTLQPGFFAVHLHAGLEEGSCRGMSGRSSTFNSPCLASTEDFKIDMIEAWALSDEVLQAAECTDVGVMGRAETKTDKMMLELVGRDFYSAE